MYIIGENIHIISQKVKDALRDRDAKFFQESGRKTGRCRSKGFGPKPGSAQERLGRSIPLDG